MYLITKYVFDYNEKGRGISKTTHGALDQRDGVCCACVRACVRACVNGSSRASVRVWPYVCALARAYARYCQ